MSRILTIAAMLAATTLAAPPVVHAADDAAMTKARSMAAMDTDRDGYVTREEFMAAIERLVALQTAKMPMRGGKLTREQVRELEKALSRTLGADALE